jgi:hypothetical protein
MDDFVRRAIMEADAGQRDFDCWEANQRQKQYQQQERARQQAAHAAEQRNVRAWLTQSRGEVQTTDFLDARHDEGTGNDAAWNEWAKSIAHEEALAEATTVNNQIVDDLEKFNDELQKRFDRRKKYFEKQDAGLQAQIDALEQRVAMLEAELEELRSEIGGNATRSTVLPLLTFKGKGGRDAAA